MQHLAAGQRLRTARGSDSALRCILARAGCPLREARDGVRQRREDGALRRRIGDEAAGRRAQAPALWLLCGHLRLAWV